MLTNQRAPLLLRPALTHAGIRSAADNRAVQFAIASLPSARSMEQLVSAVFEHDVNKNGFVDIFDVVAAMAAANSEFAASLPPDFFPTG